MFNLFKRLKPRIGMEMVDKEFDDTRIVITAISKSGKNVRYKYITVQGKKVKYDHGEDIQDWKIMCKVYKVIKLGKGET